MFSSSRRLFLPFFVYLSFVLALVQAHDVHPSHNMKRFLKKRSPLPQFDRPVVGAGAIPSLPASSPSPSDTPTSTSQSTTSSTSSESSTSSSASSSASSSVSQSSSSISSSSAPSTTDTHTSEILNLTNAPSASTSTVVPTITRTQSVDAAQDTGNAAPVSGAAAAKGTTFTVIIAVAASIGGAAILWTIFRKWKLSSSKKFDQRLNPITNWQPDATDDNGIIPNHRRAPSRASSFHSGSGHAHGNSNDHDLEHDFTAGPATSSAPIGGYADLARATSPLPPMQEHLTRGPSFNNRSYDMGVPIHHQGY